MKRRFFLRVMLVLSIIVISNKLYADDAGQGENETAGTAENKNPVLVVTGAKVEQDIGETVEAV